MIGVRRKRRRPWMFDGVRVSSTDVKACGAEGFTYMCTRLPGHSDEHIAHVFNERTGAPTAVVERWPNTEDA
jgi:hypothetical protein